MINIPAQRMVDLKPHFFSFLSTKIAVLRGSGFDVIRLDEGAPDLPPPQHIIDALSYSASLPDRHSYQSHRGTSALRNAWATMYQGAYGVQLDPDCEILPLLGSKEGIFHLLLAMVDPGDIVLIPDPGYVTYTRGTQISGGEPVYFPLDPGNGYLPDFKSIPSEIAKRAKLLWLNYPNNPTATLANREIFKCAVDFAQENGLLLCHDAAYSQVVFDGSTPLSLLGLENARQVAVEFNTLSKSHNMAGWRVGAVLGNSQIIKILLNLKTNVDSGHFLPILEAATLAMTGDQAWLNDRNQIYQDRRDLILRYLREMGLNPDKPRGTLYIWCPVPNGWSSENFASSLLENAQVSITPGTIFGKNGEGYVRIALTASIDQIEIAMERWKKWMEIWA